MPFSCYLGEHFVLVSAGAAMLHSSLQRQMEELTAAGVLHQAHFNERVLDALHCLPLANAQVLSCHRCWHCDDQCNEMGAALALA